MYLNAPKHALNKHAPLHHQAQATLKYVQSRSDLDSKGILAHGVSLGGAVVAALAAQNPAFAAAEPVFADAEPAFAVTEAAPLDLDSEALYAAWHWFLWAMRGVRVLACSSNQLFCLGRGAPHTSWSAFLIAFCKTKNLLEPDASA